MVVLFGVDKSFKVFWVVGFGGVIRLTNAHCVVSFFVEGSFKLSCIVGFGGVIRLTTESLNVLGKSAFLASNFVQ